MESDPFLLQQEAFPRLTGAQENLMFSGQIAEDAERLPQAILIKVNQAVIQNDGQRRPSLLGKEPDQGQAQGEIQDRKSTRLNSSHVKISYAVFCLKKN